MIRYKILSVLLFIILFSLSAEAKDRCQDFVPDVRSQ